MRVSFTQPLNLLLVMQYIPDTLVSVYSIYLKVWNRVLKNHTLSLKINSYRWWNFDLLDDDGDGTWHGDGNKNKAWTDVPKQGIWKEALSEVFF